MPHIDRTDFLIVGSGIAGLATALKASRYGNVRLITKGAILDSNTRYAQGGIAAAIGPGDTPASHLRDTLKAGHDLCLTDAASVLVHDAPQRIRELIELGARFDQGPDGSLALGREGAHSRNRILHARGDATGHELAKVLAERVYESPRIEVSEHHWAIDLIKIDGRCHGVSAFNDQGERLILLAYATVLATGGCGRVYKYTTNPDVATGDGFAMAARRGVPLQDMEFVQFHPTALATDDDPMILVSEAVRGEGARLVTGAGQALMEGRHPQGDLAPRDVVAREAFAELAAGGSVYLDASSIGTRFPSRFPTIYKACIARGIDPTRDPIPITPAAHFIMGGIRTDTDGRTSLPGLFACGEVACTGVHGANRLASNSLLEGLVFAERIALNLSRELGARIVQLSADSPVVEELRHAPLPLPHSATASMTARLRELMWQHAGIRRNAQGLNLAQQTLAHMADELPAGAWTLRNMIDTARRIVQAALEREESRGGHFREDFPTEREEWRGRHVHV